MAVIEKLNDHVQTDFLHDNALTPLDDYSELILKLLKRNVPIKHIQNITGCSLDQILKIKNWA